MERKQVMTNFGSTWSQRSGIRAQIAPGCGGAGAESLSLGRLLPSPPSRPPVEVRTLNGYHFWPVARCGGGDAALRLHLGRAFAVQPPRPARREGNEARCVYVELAPSVRERVQEELRRDLAPDDSL